MVDPIGDLDANTTIIVPVKITLKTRTKRSFACRLLLTYHYFCGDVRSNSAAVSISRGCGGSGGGYGWSKNFIVIWMIWYVPLIINTTRSFPHVWLINGFVTRITWQVPLVEQELRTLPECLSSPPVFSGIRVTQSLVLWVCFVDRCLSFFFWLLCCLSFSIYGFWLPLWYL
jgi:hypothetical protein